MSTRNRLQELERQLKRFTLPASVRMEIQNEMDLLEQALAQAQAAENEEKGIFDALAASAAQVDELQLDRGRATSQGALAAPQIDVINMDDVDRFEKLNVTSDRDVERRNKQVMKSLRDRGPLRDLRVLPRDWQRRLDRLEKRFPNFRAPIDYLRASLYASGRRDGSVHWPSPMLFDGPAGIGKSLFCEALAESFQLPIARLDMASAQSASALTGSDIFWSNTRAGRLFSEVLLGPVANPLFVLDEVDKARGDERYPAGAALYTVLEPRTASVYEDLSFPGIKFRADKVLWAASSNCASQIDLPILDRMRVFSIEPPSREAMLGIVRSTVDHALADLRLTRREITLGRAALEQLARLPPRALKRTVMESVALTAMHRRRRLQIAGDRVTTSQKRIGFV